VQAAAVPIPEALVAQVVTEVSQRLAEPSYAQLSIGAFVEAHPDASRYLAARLDALGGGESVMHAVFHAELMHECFRRHLERDLPPVRFRDLDAAARGEAQVAGDPEQALRRAQPALADFVASNVEAPSMRSVVALVALAMQAAAQRPGR
jgi:hypothetical protein